MRDDQRGGKKNKFFGRDDNFWKGKKERSVESEKEKTAIPVCLFFFFF